VVSLVSLMKASSRFPCVASSSDTWTPSAASALISGRPDPPSRDRREAAFSALLLTRVGDS